MDCPKCNKPMRFKAKHSDWWCTHCRQLLAFLTRHGYRGAPAENYQHEAHHIQRAAYEDAVEDMKEAGLRRVKACELSGYKD